MTISKKDIWYGFVSIGALVCLMVFIYALTIIQAQPAKAGAPTGLVTSIASSTMPMQVGTTSPTTVFSTSTPLCTSRVISTTGQAIMIAISSSSVDAARNVPSATNGLYQAASTTVAYDSGIYGCGWWTAYGFQTSSSVPSTTITIAQFK